VSSILHALRKLPPVSEGGRLFLETNDSGSAERHGLLAALATVAVMGWLLGTSAGLVVRRVWAPSWEPTTVARLAPTNEPARPPVAAAPPKAVEGPDGHRYRRDPHRRSAHNAKRAGPSAPSTRSPFPRASREIRKSSPAVSPLLTEQRGNDIDQPAAASVDAKPLIPSASSVEPAATLPQPEVPAASAPLFQEPVAVAGGASVEVFGNQRATVAGQATSLRSLVEEICRQAGVELRTYTAADRAACQSIVC